MHRALWHHRDVVVTITLKVEVKAKQEQFCFAFSLAKFPGSENAFFARCSLTLSAVCAAKFDFNLQKYTEVCIDLEIIAIDGAVCGGERNSSIFDRKSKVRDFVSLFARSSRLLMILISFFSVFAAFTKLTFEADVIPRRGSHIPKVCKVETFFSFNRFIEQVYA